MLKIINNKSKMGFTLSEVLITIGVLSIVVAMVIPVIKQAAPNQNKVMLRKSYYNLRRAMEVMQDDPNIYPTTQTTLLNGTLTLRGFNYSVDPSGAAGTADKFCYYLVNTLRIQGATCPAATAANGSTNQLGITSDGMLWFYRHNVVADQFPLSPESSAYNTKIAVDVNGSKGANCSADTITTFLPTSYQARSGNLDKCPDPDTFVFAIKYDGTIRVGMNNFSNMSQITDQTVLEMLNEPTDFSR